MSNHPHRSTKEIRPLQHLITAGKVYPQAWAQYDDFRQGRGKDGLPDWPDWCYCPLAAAYAIISGGGDNRVALSSGRHIAGVAALAAWRVTQSIYRFDPALAAALVDTRIEKLPVEVLYRLPEWCVYIETPDLSWGGDQVHGFFAHLEYDANDGRPELRLLLDVDGEDGNPSLTGIPLHINVETLDEAVSSMLAEANRQLINEGKTIIASSMPASVAGEMASEISPFLGMLLYLCSEQPDIEGRSPERPTPIKTKKGWKLFPPDCPTVVTVGSRIGAALRQAYLDEQVHRKEESDGRSSPRPHIRRSHWHTYLTGSGKTNRVLKWMPPIAINIEDGEIPTTIRDIKP